VTRHALPSVGVVAYAVERVRVERVRCFYGLTDVSFLNVFTRVLREPPFRLLGKSLASYLFAIASQQG
jgi:hypothetical protein